MHVGVTETEQNNHYKQSEGQIRILFHLKKQIDKQIQTFNDHAHWMIEDGVV